MSQAASEELLGAAGRADPGTPDLLDWYATMHRVREFERACLRLRSTGAITGTVHPYAGHEAIAAGAISTRAPADWVASYYRCHGHAIASGVSVTAMLAEMMMRQGALCRGHGGSMHLADPRVRFMGGNAIVAANLPVAAGLAMGASVRGERGVCLSFFGDGATGPGTFHEALLLAGAQRLPVVFVCENNGWQDLTPSRRVFPDTGLARLAEGHRIPARTVDGNDAVAVHVAVREAVERARGGGGPTFVECVTRLRWFHAQSGEEAPQPYFPEDEQAEWLERDPLDLLAATLSGRGVPRAQLDAVAARAEREIAAAVAEVGQRRPLALADARLDEWVQ